MKIFDSLLQMELKATAHKSHGFNMTISLILAVVFTVVSFNLEQKEAICVFAGFLLFWNRFLVLKIKESQ